METVEQFKAKQAAELQKKIDELAELERLGDVPGLTPWLVHSRLYGIRHIGFKLVDLDAFLAWAREHCDPIYAIEGQYRIFYPHKPDTRDYAGAQIKGEGQVKVAYSSILRRHECSVFKGEFRISFELPARRVKELLPVARYAGYSDRYTGQRRIEGWSKPGGSIKQYLRVGVDKQSSDLESLISFDQLEQFFGEVVPA